jgi:hypothetical protein
MSTPSDFPIIDRLGGLDSAFEVVRSPRTNIKTKGAIRMWAQRGGIPGACIVALMEEMDARGESYSHVDFTPVGVTANGGQ